VVDGWTPANGTERAMARALEDADTQAYFQAIIEATLYLPAFDSPGPQQLVTCRSGDDTYLLVFTSLEALAGRLVGVDAFRTTSYRELADRWPNPDWLLAVDPDLPIQGYMPIQVVADGAAGLIERPVVAPAPAGETDGDLEDAIGAADVEAVVRTLLLSDVYLPAAGPVVHPVDLSAADFPWHWFPDRPATVAVFTTPQRIDEAKPPVPPTVRVPFIDLVLAWPARADLLVVNPDSALELTFPREHLPGFEAWARELLDTARVPVPASPVTLQKALLPQQVDRYLRHGWRHVSGPVFPYPAGAGEPPVYLLRWLAARPELYRSGESGWVAQAVRLPHGARLLRVERDHSETVLASYDADRDGWVPAADGRAERAAT
jgi:hypothetical protein